MRQQLIRHDIYQNTSQMSPADVMLPTILLCYRCQAEGGGSAAPERGRLHHHPPGPPDQRPRRQEDPHVWCVSGMSKHHSTLFTTPAALSVGCRPCMGIQSEQISAQICAHRQVWHCCLTSDCSRLHQYDSHPPCMALHIHLLSVLIG